MKITYTPNPLETIVELEPHEVELFRLKLKLEIYEDKMLNAHTAITDRQKEMGSLKALSLEEGVAEAVRELDPDEWCTDKKSKVDERVDELLQHYLEELKSNHAGDCTCFAMSCSKCYAEQLLGINTLKPFPGKHALHKIASAFSRWNQATQQHDGPKVSLDEAIEKLRTYNPVKGPAWQKFSQAAFDEYVPKWKAEAQVAYEYLINYRNTHFPE